MYIVNMGGKYRRNQCFHRKVCLSDNQISSLNYAKNERYNLKRYTRYLIFFKNSTSKFYISIFLFFSSRSKNVEGKSSTRSGAFCKANLPIDYVLVSVSGKMMTKMTSPIQIFHLQIAAKLP